MRDLLATVPFYNNPIPLSVSNADFERLLSFFYPSSLNELEITTVEEWTSVFSLSTDWSFRDLRKRAIEEIAKLTTPVQRILLYRRHQVNEWAYSGYEELCMRGQPPSPDDGEQLGVRTVIKVWEAQQELMKKGFCRMNCCKEFTESTIKGKFNLL
ncbi:hypothetical protein DFP72DRAFT_804149 [Ephemerocybe angulata]|uniref:BTB domain-containing protein n=1 Tax=Ephemerocybe angulata TaxID=980116 RepID=A0A8H6IB57_9AGAR|nr:hypothetical protein DFP72DRAFT_804149 [Tulosesus angulatus]